MTELAEMIGERERELTDKEKIDEIYKLAKQIEMMFLSLKSNPMASKMLTNIMG